MKQRRRDQAQRNPAMPPLCEGILKEEMNHPNEPTYRNNRHSSSRRRPSQQPGSSRVNVPSAREELERERELYSAHDPRQSAAFPAQRYAEAQKQKQEEERLSYWNNSSEVPRAGSARPARANRPDRTGGWNRIAADAERANRPDRTGGWEQPGRPDRTGSFSRTNTQRYAGRTGGFDRVSDRHGNRVERNARADGRTGGFSRTPHVGEPVLGQSQRMPKVTGQGDAHGGARPSGRGTTRPTGGQGRPSQRQEHPSQRQGHPSGGQGHPADDQAARPNNRQTDSRAGSRQSAQAGSRPSAARPSARRKTAQAKENHNVFDKLKAEKDSLVNKYKERDRRNERGPQTGRTPQPDRDAQDGGFNALKDYGAERYLNPKRSYAGSMRNRIIAAVAAVAVVGIGIFAFVTWDTTKAVAVTINGQQQTVSGDQRTINGVLDAGLVSVSPGNYLAVDGSVMGQGQGTRATATINGQQTDDLSTRLNDGDDVSITNGTDVTEDYTESDPQPVAPGMDIVGTGAVHLYTSAGEPGEKVVRTGNESGKTADVITKDPVNGTVQYYNVNTNGEKVIALTFDDGPWDKTTQEILDTLKDNGAKATFFTIGDQIAGKEDLVKQAVDNGNEVSSHSYDHADGSGQGVSLILMSSDERKQEAQKGLQAISDATGQDASTVFRSPGGNFDASVAADLSGIITADIGWNIDTGDWKKPGADVIAQRIEEASPGEILLMHDGGGDRSQTVEALKQALPKLKEEGFTFVTVQELIDKYPFQG